MSLARPRLASGLSPPPAAFPDPSKSRIRLISPPAITQPCLPLPRDLLRFEGYLPRSLSFLLGTTGSRARMLALSKAGPKISRLPFVRILHLAASLGSGPASLTYQQR